MNSGADDGRLDAALADEVAAEIAPGDLGDPSLSRVAMRGVAWNWAGAVVLVVAQVVSTVITARLIDPDEFGAYATAQAAAGFTGFLTLAALGPGLQRRPALGPRTAGTALTISAAVAALVSAALVACAGPWARAWQVPEAESTIRALAVALLFTSLAVVPLALLGRRLRFRAVMALETGSIVLGLAAGICLAIAMRSALALAIGQAVGALALVTCAAVLERRELRPAFDRAEARELATFATQVNGLGLLTYFTVAVPSWFVARNFGAGVLGLYSRATLIAALPAEYGLRGMLKVIYPLYGRFREDRARVRVLVDEALTLATGLVWPVFGALAGAAPIAVVVVLGARWEDAAPLLSLSALIVSAWVPCGVLTNAAEALGWMRTIAARQAGFLAGTAATLIVAHFAGLSVTQILVGIAITEWAIYGLTLRAFVVRGLVDRASVARVHAVHLSVGVGAYLLTAGCALALDSAPVAVGALAELGLVAAILGAIATGDRWIPVSAVLARRLGAGPGQGLLRAGWSVVWGS